MLKRMEMVKVRWNGKNDGGKETVFPDELTFRRYLEEKAKRQPDYMAAWPEVTPIVKYFNTDSPSDRGYFRAKFGMELVPDEAPDAQEAETWEPGEPAKHAVSPASPQKHIVHAPPIRGGVRIKDMTPEQKRAYWRWTSACAEARKAGRSRPKRPDFSKV